MFCILIFAAAVAESPAEPTAATPSRLHLNIDYDTPPRILRQPRPVYPTAAAVARAEGTVVVKITLSEAGEAADVRVVESIPALDRAAVDNARQWLFVPALKDGTPVRSVVYGEVTFRLGDDVDVLSQSFIVAPKQGNDGVLKLLKGLGDKKPSVRADAAWQLSAFPDAGPEVRAALLAALDDPTLAVRERAALALFAMSNPAVQEVFSLERPPPFTSRRAPRFPPGLDKTAEGQVELELLVSETGRVIHARFERRGVPEMDKLALTTASHWRYEPHVKDGKRRSFMARAAFHFEKGYAHLGDPPAWPKPAPPAVGD